MRIVQFTAPVPKDDTVVADRDELPFFYDCYHQHKEMQVTYIIRGEGTLIAGKYSQPFVSGEIYILGPNQPHIFKSAPQYFVSPQQSSCEAIHIYFDVGRLPKLFLSMPELEGVNRFLKLGETGLQLPPKYVGWAGHHIKKLVGKPSLERLLAIIELFGFFDRDVKGWKSLNTGFMDYYYNASFEGIRMSDVFNFTREHYMENITLGKIAEVANITPNAFCKYFKKHTRKTYNAFLNEIRINEACKLMIGNAFTSISNIAYSTGFNSATNFNRVFRKTTGMSPRDYLREYKMKEA